jgi:hypothetical protein
MSLRRPRKRARESPAKQSDHSTLEELAKELDTYSAAISAQVRTINVGILGLSWLMLLGDEKLARVSSKIPPGFLLGISVVCVLALVFDLSQYLFGRTAVDATFDAAAKSADRSAAYDMTSFSYRAAFWCYRFKLVLTLAGAAALMVLVAHVLI